MLGSYEIHGPDGSLLVDIDGKWKFAGIKLSAKFTNKADGVPHEISLQGKPNDTTAQMVLVQTGSVLATYSIEHAGRWKLSKPSNEEFFVQASPGIDLTLIAALAIAFEERQAAA